MFRNGKTRKKTPSTTSFLQKISHELSLSTEMSI